MPTKVLTHIAVKTAQPKRNAAGALARNEIPDRGCPGLYLQVQPSGQRSWAFRYRFNGTTKKLTFGTVADQTHEDGLTLAAARRAVGEARHQLEQGTDPAAAQRAALEAEVRLSEDAIEVFAAQFIEQYAKRRMRTWAQTERTLKRLILPAWRGRGVSTIRRRDVIELIERIASERGPYMGNRAFGVVRRLFGWLTARDVIAVSPCLGVERPAPEVPRDRILGDGEIASLWRASKDPRHGVFGPLFRLLVLCGQRRSEVAGMRWSEINTEQRLWLLPPARTKNKHAHSVPLSEQAWDIIQGMPHLGSDYVFTVNNRNPISGFSRAKHRLAAELKFADDWRLHDLRRSCASGMQRLDVPVEVIERALNHRSGAFRGVVGIYQRDPLVEQVRAGLQRWADHIDRLAGDAKVLPLLRRGR